LVPVYQTAKNPVKRSLESTYSMLTWRKLRKRIMRIKLSVEGRFFKDHVLYYRNLKIRFEIMN
jgi:hypothetical protein